VSRARVPSSSRADAWHDVPRRDHGAAYRDGSKSGSYKMWGVSISHKVTRMLIGSFSSLDLSRSLGSPSLDLPQFS
jgi:hypothetical protein